MPAPNSHRPKKSSTANFQEEISMNKKVSSFTQQRDMFYRTLSPMAKNKKLYVDSNLCRPDQLTESTKNLEKTKNHSKYEYIQKITQDKSDEIKKEQNKEKIWIFLLVCLTILQWCMNVFACLLYVIGKILCKLYRWLLP